MNYVTFFGRALDIGTAFNPTFGFNTTVGNPTGVPANILQVPHFPADQSTIDYIQQPQWIALTNLTPGETILAVAYNNPPFNSVQFDNPSITAPYLFYFKQS